MIYCMYYKIYKLQENEFERNGNVDKILSQISPSYNNLIQVFDNIKFN